MIDATITAGSAASPAYSSSRSDQGKGAGKGFLDALADTADRSQAQEQKEDDDDAPVNQDQTKTHSTAISSSSTKSTTSTVTSATADQENSAQAEQGNVADDEAIVASDDGKAPSQTVGNAQIAAGDTRAAALIAKALASQTKTQTQAQTQTAGQTQGQTETASSSGEKTDESRMLAKLVAALSQQGDAATEAATAGANAEEALAAETEGAGEETGKIAVKGRQESGTPLLAALAALKSTTTDEEAATAAAQSAMPGVTKTQTKDGSKTAKPAADDTKDTAAEPKVATGAQDALTLLGDLSAGQLQQAAHQAGSQTTAKATTGNSDTALTAVAGQVASQDDKAVKIGQGTASVDLAKQAKADQSGPQDAVSPATKETVKDSSAADALHLVTSSDASASPADDTASQSTTTGIDPLQNVSVLDSRRIIAPVNTSNGANIAASMAGDSSWAQAMHTHASDKLGTSEQISTDRTMNTLKLKMTPENLGSVTATLKLTNGELTVSLDVENSAAYRKLNEDQNGLVAALKSHGFSVDNVQISIASTEKPNNDNQTNSQSQSSNQQSMQQGGGSSSQGGNRSQAQPIFDVYGQTSGGPVDDAARSGTVGTGGNASGGSGQLYL
ncbi:flagellar hook-length control protein FliK [Agrobacterium vitis]|uniref:flagellar hook-length control protein FliK n=1 Tax=Agrobacterium vitis TaxID=373 RepID=UPI002035CE0E|nr:flagellar hook-length control protein FliK [Agrobacterium vitis]MCM2452730.1 flagellar hook-length control protein FliK [Agrobacterium vitis]